MQKIIQCKKVKITLNITTYIKVFSNKDHILQTNL